MNLAVHAAVPASGGDGQSVYDDAPTPPTLVPYVLWPASAATIDVSTVTVAVLEQIRNDPSLAELIGIDAGNRIGSQ